MRSRKSFDSSILIPIWNWTRFDFNTFFHWRTVFNTHVSAGITTIYALTTITKIILVYSDLINYFTNRTLIIIGSFDVKKPNTHQTFHWTHFLQNIFCFLNKRMDPIMLSVECIKLLSKMERTSNKTMFEKVIMFTKNHLSPGDLTQLYPIGQSVETVQ